MVVATNQCPVLQHFSHCNIPNNSVNESKLGEDSLHSSTRYLRESNESNSFNEVWDGVTSILCGSCPPWIVCDSLLRQAQRPQHQHLLLLFNPIGQHHIICYINIIIQFHIWLLLVARSILAIYVTMPSLRRASPTPFSASLLTSFSKKYSGEGLL